MSFYQGTAFTDLGATWTDTRDGSGTILVATSGSVNVNTPGTYILQYKKIDAAGNVSNIVTRTVTVIGLGGGGGG